MAERLRGCGDPGPTIDRLSEAGHTRGVNTEPRGSTHGVLVGAIAVLPSLLFVAANLLKYGLGVDQPYRALEPVIESPSWAVSALVIVLVLGGPLASLALSLVPIVRLRAQREASLLVGTVALKLSWPHLAIGALSLTLLGILGAHLVAENLPCLTGAAEAC